MKTILYTLAILVIWSCEKNEYRPVLDGQWQLRATHSFNNDSLNSSISFDENSIYYHFRSETNEQSGLLEITEDNIVQEMSYTYDQEAQLIQTSTSLTFVVEKLDANYLNLSQTHFEYRWEYQFEREL